jgi:hypothetical protein
VVDELSCGARQEDKSDALRGEIKVTGIRKGEIELLGNKFAGGVVFLSNNFRRRLKTYAQNNCRAVVAEKTRLCS